MQRLWQQFLADESGVVVSSELVLVGTVGVLGMVVGLEAVCSSVNQELNDLSHAFGAIDQSFSFRSLNKVGHGWIRGSGFNDRGDFCDCAAISQTEVIGQVGEAQVGSRALVQETPLVTSPPVVQERVVSERVIDEAIVTPCPPKPAAPVGCDPKGEIIEEHIIRRRISPDCAKSLPPAPPIEPDAIQPTPDHSHPPREPEPEKAKPQPRKKSK